MIKSVEVISWSYKHDVATFVENVCPEVTLFEQDYLPSHFRQSAFGSASWLKESSCFEAEAKHYSECAEFSRYLFFNRPDAGATPMRSRTSVQIPEKALENYLVDNLTVLEPGLELVDRQRAIGRWRVDIVATDQFGGNVLMELKSKTLNRDDIDRLNGQISRYYHRMKSGAGNWRIFIVIPKDSRGLISNIYHGLKPWIDGNEVVVFQFDYNLYGREFTFTKTALGENEQSGIYTVPQN
jgi:hypothetical protein